MDYEGRIIRPPSEASSLILQASVGCSHNRCTFCPAYKEKVFRVKPLEHIYAAINRAAQDTGAAIRRVFICDGDPLCMPAGTLSAILGYLSKCLPRLQRVGIYATAGNILAKSLSELTLLHEQKLGIIYLGLESGDRQTLIKVNKGNDPEEMVEAARLVKRAGIKLNVTVLLGLGGSARSGVHARETIRVINRMQPEQVAALTLMLVPGTPLYEEARSGSFVMPDEFGLLRELYTMVAGAQLHKSLFLSDHASNYFPIRARMPRDRQSVQTALAQVIAARDKSLLRSEQVRGL